MGRIGVLFELRHADTRLVTESEPRCHKTETPKLYAMNLAGIKHSTGDLMEHIYIYISMYVWLYDQQYHNVCI